MMIPSSPVPSFFNLSILNLLLVRLGRLLALLSEFSEGGPEDSSSPFFLYRRVFVGVLAVSANVCRLLETGSGSFDLRGGFFITGSFFSFLI